jgi:replicative DNA helicase
MKRRNFLKMLGAVPLCSLVGLDNTKGMASGLSGFNLLKKKELSELAPLSNLLLSKTKPGDVVLIGSRPSQGKSVLALNLVHEICVKLKKSVYFISYEQSEQNIMKKLISIETKSIARSRSRVTNSKLVLSDKQLNVENLSSEIKHHTDYIFVDYLQLVPAALKYKSRSEQVSESMKMLKKLAFEKKAVVILVAQLNRGVCIPNYPTPSDIRETRHRESLDRIILVHRIVNGGPPQLQSSKILMDVYNPPFAKPKVFAEAEIWPSSLNLENIKWVLS